MGVTAVRDAIALCSSHLASTGTVGTEIESFLTQYLLMASYAAFEDEVRGAIDERASMIADDEAANYVRLTLSNVKRGLKIAELAGLIGRFSETAKEGFSSAVVNTEAQRAWDSILNDRHASAHGEGAKLTMSEFTVIFDKALQVLVEFAAALKILRSYV